MQCVFILLSSPPQPPQPPISSFSPFGKMHRMQPALVLVKQSIQGLRHPSPKSINPFLLKKDTSYVFIEELHKEICYIVLKNVCELDCYCICRQISI